MITVSIVEDDADFRKSLALLIDGTPGLECINTYRDCETAIAGIAHDPPDVVLMDLRLPGMSGIDGIRIIKENLPDINLVVLTVHGESKLVFEALCAGACGYLLKDTPPAKLLEAIKETYDGGAPMSTQIARMVVGSFRTNPHAALTQRETEVLAQLCKGKSYKMIADTLFISEETVRRHIKNIYKKLQVGSKSEAVAKALKEKLVYT
ncbi:MAG: response regulator transcription factor [candidate division KSB1 bacterium]|nr:response regulator transcription factor [candidate division KSB1 bacterium]MDZ7296770.1 response regulator transcription factor [candidate division KSB1 bacterium]MDZ7347636.1 response regulator transcription factor [candidate division KSB1 bacterium]MDZ7351941.1 response regulator transcription factor [candidate division KSB1 bacterium]MDZ7380600.1 response regulator transcription factor [candidate division KSB1 bacterium]